MKLIKVLDDWNGFAELYQYGDSYIVISTIQEEDRPSDAVRAAWVEMTEILTTFDPNHEVLPAHGEETMVFLSDAEGEVTQFEPSLEKAFGDNSRERVMKKLTQQEQ